MKKIIFVLLAVLMVACMSITASAKAMNEIYPDFSKVSPGVIMEINTDGFFGVKEYGSGRHGEIYELKPLKGDETKFKNNSWVEIVKEDGRPKYIRAIGSSDNINGTKDTSVKK